MNGNLLCRVARLFLCVIALSLAGCNLAPTPTLTLDMNGPVVPPQSDGAGASSNSTGLVGLFQASYAIAYGDALQISHGDGDKASTNDTGCIASGTPLPLRGCAPLSPESSSRSCIKNPGPCSEYSIHARQMAVDGVAVVDANCDAYFESLGGVQQNVIFIRDLLGSVGTVAAGAAGLVASTAAPPAAVGFTIATSNSGLDIYSRNSLFGADNIQSVWQLVQSALNLHKIATLPEPDNSTWTFAAARQVILDQQDICQPANILLLTRQIIAHPTLQAVDSTGRIVAQTDGPPPGQGGNGGQASPPRASAHHSPPASRKLTIRPAGQRPQAPKAQPKKSPPHPPTSRRITIRPAGG